MQWNLCLLTFFMFGVFQTLLPQSYIIKFRSSVADSSEIRTVITQHLDKSNQRINKRYTYSLQSLSKNNISEISGFPWEKYLILNSDVEISDQLFEEIKEISSLEYIQKSLTYRVYSQPNDSAYSSQWNLTRIGIANLYSSGILSATLPTVIVGVIDTGIDDEHPDLINNIAMNTGETGLDGFGNDKRFNNVDDDSNGFIDDWRGYDFVNWATEDFGDWKDRDNHPSDEHGHGTSVSGIIGSEINNTIGLSGITTCKILPLRAFGMNGNGNDIDISSAIIYAVDNGAEVINMSFGDVVSSFFMHDAIRYAYENNVVLVASSGNDGSNKPHFPSDFPEVISTGSVNRFDVRSFYSSFSPSLDIMAPGEQIVTTTLGGGYTKNFSGTSAAAPHVAGVSALLKSLEKKKKILSPNYVSISSEEIRGILLNTADDAGSKGWDEKYGAGILNAEKAVQAVSGSIVTIHSPAMDEILTDNFKNIILSASTPYLHSVQLLYGRGDSPEQWMPIASIINKILIKDTIEFLDKILLPEDIYILRLIVKNSKGNDVEYRQRIQVLRSPPKILSFQFRDSVIIEDKYGAIIEARTDRNSIAQLYYRISGEINYRVIQSPGMQKNHTFLLTAKDFIPNLQYEAYCEFTERSSQQRSTKFFISDSISSPLVISSATIPTTGFRKKSFELPKGFLVNQVITNYGYPAVVLNEYDRFNDFGNLKVFEFDGTRFVLKDSTVRSWIPRSIQKETDTNYSLILVQDRGNSQLLKGDNKNRKYFSTTSWGDSSDVWASQLVDLNGDNRPEVIARNSSEYLIYQNIGENRFTLATRLPNPSKPLLGDAKNQFGPPKSIVGDFTNSGFLEIMFADYDGDLLLYRQSALNSLNFNLVGIDTSNLFEMSDYISSGDFNGDGILDVAVAGHSNLDWNQDREYDAPVWTIRVFSHLPSNQRGVMTKIWEQHFYGVHAGSAYDNGITSGKLLKTDSINALMVSLNPNLYVFIWNSHKKIFEAIWNHSSHSNNIIVYDFDNDGINEVGFHTTNATEFWSREYNSLLPQTPWGVMATSLSKNSVNLQWSSISTNHNIYRGITKDSLVLIATINSTVWSDSMLTENVRYYYSVSSFTGNESVLSEIVSVIPHSPVVITAVEQKTMSQLRISLSFDVLSEEIAKISFLLNNNILSGSVLWNSPRSLLVSFRDSIYAGNHLIKIKYLKDESGMMADTGRYFSFVLSYQNRPDFFVRSASLISNNKIKIEFSERPDLVQALIPSNYMVKTIAQEFTVASIIYDTSSAKNVTLQLAHNADLRKIALRIEVAVSENIISFNGVSVMNGKGQTLSIAQMAENIHNIVVFPNPVKNTDKLFFVNIPTNCAITIFSISGERIKNIESVSSAEGIYWNLLDDRGNPVSSGVYLYRVEWLDDIGGIVQTKLGKFAVIR